MASRRGGALVLLVGVLGRVCVSGLSASSNALKAHTAFVNRATGGGGAASPASGAAAAMAARPMPPLSRSPTISLSDGLQHSPGQ